MRACLFLVLVLAPAAGCQYSKVDLGTPTATPTPTPDPSDWWNCDFGFRQPLVVDFGDAQLTEFPVLLRLDSSSIDYSRLGPDGADLRLVAPGGVELPYEIERWDPSGDSLVWLRMPTTTSSASQMVFAYYGSAGAADAQDPALWSGAGYAGVFHLDDPASIPDGTVTGAVSGSGVVGDGLDFDGTDDFVAIDAPFRNTLTSWTVSLWVRVDALGSTDPFIAYLNGDASFGLMKGFGNALRLEMTTGGAAASYTGGSMSAGTLYHVASTYDAVTRTSRLYRDGVEEASFVHAAGALDGGTAPVELGHGVMNDFLDGMIDEVRVSATVRPIEWIQAERASIDPDAVQPFVSLGSAEPSSCPE